MSGHKLLVGIFLTLSFEADSPQCGACCFTAKVGVDGCWLMEGYFADNNPLSHVREFIIPYGSSHFYI